MPRSAATRSASTSSWSVELNWASCSARSASSPSAGDSSRAATMARHAREVAETWFFGAVAKGIP